MIIVWPLWPLFFEYVLGFPIPQQLRSDPKIKAFEEKVTELYLAIDDHYMVIHKLITDDITSRVFSYANDKKCSIQEAIDHQFEYTSELYSQCKELADKLVECEEATEQFKKWVTAILEASHKFVPLLAKVVNIYVKSDQTIGSNRWSEMYDDMVNGQVQAVPFDIEKAEDLLN